MRWKVKICENKECWEIMWCFPRKKCQFCNSIDYLEYKATAWFVIWMTSMYSDDNKMMAVIRNHKWCDHLIVRVKIWEWNDCDHNWWYIHYPCIDDADEMERMINAKIAKEGKYIFKE